MRLQWLGLLAPALLLGGCDFSNDDKDKAAPSPPAQVAATQIDGDYLLTGGDGTNWAAIGFNYYEQRFSPLSAIDRGNVAQLGVAWSSDMPAGTVPQSTPLAVDGKIYVTTPRSQVVAFDATTGEQLWTFDSGVTEPATGQRAADVGNQGLAIWKGRLYFGTLDGRLTALDAITGAQLWSVQTGGAAGQYQMTAPPRIVKNMVIVGSGRAGNGGRGYVSAYDTTDGALRWRFYTVPKPDAAGDQASSDAVLATARQTWSSTSLGAAAGGYVTDAVTYDPDLNRIYIGVGAGPAADAAGGDRLFLSSIVALNADDGEFLWHYQETPGGRPAYGAGQPFLLADLPISRRQPSETNAASADARAKPAARPTPDATPTTQNPVPTGPVPTRKVLMQASDNGFFFVIDRTNGKLISATPLFDQPGWTEGYDPQTGRPARIGAPDADRQSSRIARSLTPVAAPRPIFPPIDAARAPRWMSFNPQTRLIYVTLPRYAEQVPDERNVESAEPRDPVQTGWRQDGARIVAFDPVLNSIRWSRDLTAARNGGPLSTAGGLLFLGTGVGRFVALDATNGETLYSADLGSGIVGAPSTFIVEGLQYVAVLTGLGGTFDWPAPAAPGDADDSPAAREPNARQPSERPDGWLLRVPAQPRLVLLRLGGSERLPPVPRARPSPVPTPAPAPRVTPSPPVEPARR